ncbi:MAG: protein-tyrosine-phosphatase [Gammaproteobacteria bacterium]|nr:MAG: protein-tyrosine-phosphatase [Gammaproteobacteria bacterium]
MKKVLFVCMGNICRSAMAEGILQEKIQVYGLPLSVDSAGTHSYHNGEPYDPRARAELASRGINVDELRSRRIRETDFRDFDVILVADHSNLRHLREEFGDLADKAQLITHFSPVYQEQDVPDPYYGGKEGFADVYKMLDKSIDAWLEYENLR